jgi:serine protein kinase
MSINNYNQRLDTTEWNGTVKDFLPMVQQNPKLGQLSHARVLDMIESAGVNFDEEDKNKLDPKYNFFSDDLFGMDEPIRKIVKYLKAAASGSQVGRRILLLYGPTSSGKSQLATLLKRGLEEWSKTEEGAIYAIADCPIHENPLDAVPHTLRRDFREKHGIKIDPLARLCPVCQYNLDNKYKGDWLSMPVKRVFMSESNRLGIGTFLPGDSKSQSITELVGSVDFSKLGEFGIESDPRAYKFDGELNVSNRGIMEMIEMLKVDPKFLYVLLTLAQEKTIKTERFPLIYADEFILSHSVTGDTVIPYMKNDKIYFNTIRELTDRNDTNIKVLAINLENKNPEWTDVKSFFAHQFSGNLIRTVQKNGIVDTTYNHSIYSTDFKCFYPEEKKNILVLRKIPETQISDTVELNIPDDGKFVEDNVYINERLGSHGNGMLKKHFVKGRYSVSNDKEKLFDLLKVFAWYITEGHVNDAHAIISQGDMNVLKEIKIAVENISSSRASLQNRESKSDKTSRLHLSTEVWKKVLECNCGKYSVAKRIPDFVCNLPNEFKLFLFREMLRGDGSTKTSVKNASEECRKNNFTYKTVSKILATQLGFLLAQLNIDFSIYHGYTKNGKEYFDIRYRKNDFASQGTNKIETFFVEDSEVFDIECVGNHSFVGGVGNVVLHNTNETEYRRFLGDAKLEALHDRIIVQKVPYNLIVDEEVKIYQKLLSEADFGSIHVAPLTLKVAAMFAVLSRLELGKDQNLTLLKKMQLYNGEDVDGFTKDNVKDIKEASLREGMEGISPRYIFNCIADCFTKYDLTCITPIDILRAIKDNFENNPKLKKEDIDRFDDLLTIVVQEYTKMAKNEVQKAFFVSFEEEIHNLLNNYVDNVGAYLDKSEVTDEFGDRHEPDHRLMRSVEEKIGISDSAKDSFREEIYRKVITNKSKGKFDYKSHAKLKEALEKQLFDERADTIRLTVSTRNPDEEGLKKINQVIATLVDKHGYTVESANQLLRFVNNLMAKTT